MGPGTQPITLWRGREGGGLGEWKMVGQGVKKGGRVKNKRRCLLDQGLKGRRMGNCGWGVEV